MAEPLALRPGEKLSSDARQEYIFEIRDLIMDEGIASLHEITTRYNVDRKTAVAWRAMALKQMEKNDNGFTRESIRAMQIGRINRTIERLTTAMAKADTADDIDGLTKLAAALKGHQDSLHKITGLNTDVHVNVNDTPPLVIVRSRKEA